MIKRSLAHLFLVSLLASLFIACGEDEAGEKSGDGGDLRNSFEAKVIYGEDDRKDLYQVSDNRLLHLAKGTAVLMDSYNLEKSGNKYNVKAQSFKSQFNLCEGERFADQDSAGFCSGFLVGPQTLVTAGHCIRRTNDCNNARFVFDYAISSKNAGSPKSVHENQVYRCTKLIKSFVQSRGADYAVVQLDRPVTGRTPLQFRTDGQIPTNAGLVVIGHPSGIPTKIAGGANVRGQDSGFFVANLDTYGGNSGSAVFNSQTGLVEGILVRGERDFVYKGNCKISNVCADNACRGEDVTRITEAVPYIPNSKKNRDVTKLLYKYLGFDVDPRQAVR